MKIKETIRKYGYTLEMVAKAMDTSISNVSQIVNGNPTIQKLRDIADVLECPVWEFFLDEMNLEDVRQRLNKVRPAMQINQADDLPLVTDAGKRPDLIVIDRESGTTRNYILMK